MAKDLDKAAKDLGIRYFLISFTDLFGVQRSKLAPASAIVDMHNNGAGFAGFATHLDMSPADPDMFAMPDPASLIQLPWKPEVGWLAADLRMNGEAVAQAPRVALRKVLAEAQKQGYRMMAGVEAEYFIIAPDGDAISDPRDAQDKPCYDQSCLMRRYDVISEICDAMQTLGWGPYQNDHEDANGQYEMNWDYADALTTADRHAFFKFMVKSIAEKHGLRATFMPKPFAHLTGNGCHSHVSLWGGKDGKKNLFLDKKGELGLSKLAYHFLGGLLRHAGALCAITNPTVNSYKRINAPITSSGSTWAPNTITYGGNNRTHMVRVPDPGRFEIRLADGAANPYLMQAAFMVAGMDGVANETDPGKRLDIDMYAHGQRVRARRLPLNMLDALRNLGRDKVLRAGLGDALTTAFIKLKTDEWNSFMRHHSSWERANSLDC